MHSHWLHKIGVTLALFALVAQALALPGTPCADMATGVAAVDAGSADRGGHHAAGQPAPDAHPVAPAAHGDTTHHPASVTPVADSGGCCDHGDCVDSSCLSTGSALLAVGWGDLSPRLNRVAVHGRRSGQPGHPALLFRPPASR